MCMDRSFRPVLRSGPRENVLSAFRLFFATQLEDEKFMSYKRDLPEPGIEQGSSALQAHSLLAE